MEWIVTVFFTGLALRYGGQDPVEASARKEVRRSTRPLGER